MMLSEFSVQHCNQFAEPLSAPGPHFSQQESVHSGVALGQIQLRSNPAAFLAAEENVGLEHSVANIFEPDRCFPHFASKFRGDLVDHFRSGESFGDVTCKLARAGKMPEQ